MSQSPLDAFFLGRATASLLRDNAEHLLTDILSEVAKFDAEQKERLRQFTKEVRQRAEQEAGGVTPNTNGDRPDLQAMIDELRAEIARLRSELQRYRNR